MDYVTTARAKGQTERRIMTGHVLRNALLPIVTIAGVQAGNLIGGSIVVETVFGWPASARLPSTALQSRDLNLLLAIFFMSACLIVIINLAVDVIYVMLDPRMRFNMRAGFARFARNRMALFGAAVLLCLLLLVVLTPVIYPDDPFKLAGPALQPPGRRFLLGTDTLAATSRRKSLTRRAPRSSSVSVRPSPQSVFGAVAGGVAGYYRGRTETC